MSERTSSASPAMINLIIENDGTGNTIVGDDYIYGIFKFFRTPNGSKTSGISSIFDINLIREMLLNLCNG